MSTDIQRVQHCIDAAEEERREELHEALDRFELIIKLCDEYEQKDR